MDVALLTQLLVLLKDATKTTDGGDKVLLERGLVAATVEGLQAGLNVNRQLEEVSELLSLKPTLAKKLNDKIKSLQAEIEVLRSDYKVNELERKVVRLEAELRQSYQTKNYTLKNGLLEIEKEYHDFIHARADVEELWGEVNLLLLEEREGYAPGGVSSRRATSSRHTLARTSLGGLSAAAVESPGRNESVVKVGVVQQEVAKIQEGGPLLLHPATLPPLPPHPLYHGGRGDSRRASDGVADARASDTLTDVTSLPGDKGGVRGMHDVYWSPPPPQQQAHAPRAARGVFNSNGPALERELTAQEQIAAGCVSALRILFASAGPLPQQRPQGSPQAGAMTAAAAAAARARGPDARSSDVTVDALHGSIQDLMALYASLAGYAGGASVSPGAKGGGGGGGAAQRPDALHFWAQSEAVLGSIRHLREQYGVEHAGAASGGAGGAGGGDEGGGGAHGSVEAVEAEAQFQALEGSVLALRATLDAGTAEAAAETAAAAGGGGLARGPGSVHVGGSGAASVPSGSFSFHPELVPVEPLMALFTSFMAHAASSGAYPSKPSKRSAADAGAGAAGTGAEDDGAGGGGVEGGGVEGGGVEGGSGRVATAAPSVYELATLFRAYLRTPGGPPGLGAAHRDALAAAGEDWCVEGGGEDHSGGATYGRGAGGIRRSGAGGERGVTRVDALEDAQRSVAERHAGVLRGEGAGGDAARALWADACRLHFVAAAGSDAASVGREQAAVEATYAALLAGGDGDDGDAVRALWADTKAMHLAAAAGAADAEAAGDAAGGGAAAAGGVSFRVAVDGSVEVVRASSSGGGDAGDAGGEALAVGGDRGSGSGGGAAAAQASGAADADGEAEGGAEGGAEGKPVRRNPGTEIKPDGGTSGSSSSAAGRFGGGDGGGAGGNKDAGGVLDQLASLNMTYVERLAEQNLAMASLAGKQQASQALMGELQTRLGSIASEAASLREDNDSLTRLLVEAKMGVAECESENQRLKQRLQRSLRYENTFRDENEGLRMQMAAQMPAEAPPPAPAASRAATTPMQTPPRVSRSVRL
ncbi:hypothetical protein FOA52_010181 [Chlamydomonas sp. UWO 241]|nr:hypothetical protein FOA52_010181 [Chlamydomonas sp. UWO 241]